MPHDDDENNLVEICISSALTDIEQAKKDANDLAWEHATEFCKQTGLGFGSTEFEELFRQLSQNYEQNTDYIKFFLMTAMLTVRELLETGVMALPHTGDRMDEKDILELVSGAARAIMGSYMWLAAGQTITWPPNESMPDDVTVSFYFDEDDITPINDEEV